MGQYFLAALHGDLPPEHLLHYRAANSKLPGHPELGLTPGVKFSSGRLGHMWPLVNGVAMANPDKITFCLGSDGSFQEGNDAEAARLAVAKQLNVKILFDDNDVTVSDSHLWPLCTCVTVIHRLPVTLLNVISLLLDCVSTANKGPICRPKGLFYCQNSRRSRHEGSGMQR